MAYNNELARGGGVLVVDIETYAIDGADAYLEAVSAPANYKDPEKIAAYQAERRVELLSKCALDPDLCRIVAIGTQRDDVVRIETMPTEAAEAAHLTDFWATVRAAEATLIGFNILSFDLPVLIRRSQYLNLHVPALNLDRYRTNHIDLMERLSFNGKLKYRGLDFYTKRFKLDVPADATTGKHIAAMVEADDWAGIEAHCRCDVVKTAALARRIGVLADTTARVWDGESHGKPKAEKLRPVGADVKVS